MTEMQPDSAPRRRVKFGPNPHQTMPHEWAESAFEWIFVHHPHVFGDALQHAAGIEPGARRRGRAAQ